MVQNALGTLGPRCEHAALEGITFPALDDHSPPLFQTPFDAKEQNLQWALRFVGIKTRRSYEEIDYGLRGCRAANGLCQ